MNPSYTLRVVTPVMDHNRSLSDHAAELWPRIRTDIEPFVASHDEPSWRLTPGADEAGWDAYVTVIVAEIPVRLRRTKEQRVRALVAEGFSDWEIGQVMGMRRDSVCKYRRRLGIPAAVRASQEAS